MSSRDKTTNHRTATPDEPVTISLQNGAARHEVSVDFLRDCIARGDLPAYRIGKGRGLIRVRVSDLDAMFRPIATVGTLR